jgi:sugar phosphate isomerase/epimerase
MSIFSDNRGLTRRDLLAAGMAAAGAQAVSRAAKAGLPATAHSLAEGDFGPFKMGLQSYSLRGYTTGGRADLKKALAATRELGLHYWESYTAHIPLTADRQTIRAIKEEIESQGVHASGYGVVHLGKDEAANRKIFDFAKTLGVSYLSIDPDPASFDLLDRLVDEYDIPLGIHNHGPGHKFALIDTIAKAINDHSPKIGCCIDTGHFLRSKEDPVRAAEVFGTRVYGVHLKDVKNSETFTILGQGDLRTVELLRVLASNKYGHCLAIEYEEKPDDPLEDIKACLAAAKKAIAALASA